MMRTGALIAAFLATSAAVAQPARRLVQAQRYGWENLDGGTRPLAAAERKLSGGMLGNVGDVAEGADGALYVLDNKELKVVVFNRDGSLRRVFAGGSGRGPGEFNRPRAITVTEAGEVFVLDQGLSRVTVFDTAGAVKRTLTLGIASPIHMLVTRDRIYVTGVIRAGLPAVRVYDHQGALIEQLHLPTPAEIEFGRAGEPVNIGRLRNGTVVAIDPNPGMWSAIGDPSKRFGRSLVVDNVVRRHPDRDTYFAPASMRGFGEMADGSILAYYMQYDAHAFDGPATFKLYYRLAILRTDGTAIATLTQGEDISNVFALSRDGQDVFLVSNEPFPQVVRFRLEARP